MTNVIPIPTDNNNNNNPPPPLAMNVTEPPPPKEYFLKVNSGKNDRDKWVFALNKKLTELRLQ